MPALSLALALFACGDAPAPEPTPSVAPAPPPAPVVDERPNVLLVLWDTVRADHLSLYGYDKPTTPALEAFAAQATVFENAWSPGTWTVPSHASMFTGLPTTSHGAHAGHRWLDAQHTTLAELLAADGYDTFAFSANVFASPHSNLLQGFQTVHTTFPRKGARNGRYNDAAIQSAKKKRIADDASTEISPKFAGSNADKWQKAVYKDSAPVLAQGLFDFLDERASSSPWFAYVNMMEAHTPRIPSQASRDAVMDPQTQQLALVTDASLFAENAYIVGRKDYSPDELQAMRGVYDAALLDLDKATGQLFAELDRRGVLDDTVVILVSDHGESLGEHRMMEHRWTIHEPLLHVPLVVRYPDALAPGRHTLPVSTTDVFATVLDLVGTDTPQDVGITAQSLRLLEGRGTVHAQLLDPFEEQMGSLRRAFKDLDLSPWRRTYCAIREGSLKYVTASDGQHALYDLATDPGEDANRLPADPDTAARLHAALHAWEAKLRPYDAANADAPSDEPVGEDERAQLVELGYIDEEDDGTTAVASVVGSCPR